MTDPIDLTDPVSALRVELRLRDDLLRRVLPVLERVGTQEAMDLAFAVAAVVDPLDA